MRLSGSRSGGAQEDSFSAEGGVLGLGGGSARSARADRSNLKPQRVRAQKIAAEAILPSVAIWKREPRTF